jgi:hypothetical protein
MALIWAGTAASRLPTKPPMSLRGACGTRLFLAMVLGIAVDETSNLLIEDSINDRVCPVGP